MSGLSELEKIIKNSKLIPENKKLEMNSNKIKKQESEAEIEFIKDLFRGKKK